MNLLALKTALKTHPDYINQTDDQLRGWLLADVQKQQRVQLSDIYRLALQRGIDDELEDLVANDAAPAATRKVAKRLLKLISQTVISDIDISHSETQADFALMIASNDAPNFDVQFVTGIAALGITTVKRHSQLGIALPLVRQIKAARAL